MGRNPSFLWRVRGMTSMSQWGMWAWGTSLTYRGPYHPIQEGRCCVAGQVVVGLEYPEPVVAAVGQPGMVTHDHRVLVQQDSVAWGTVPGRTEGVYASGIP